MVDNLIDLIARAVRWLFRPLVMVMDWRHEDFNLWTVMRHPWTSKPPGVPGDSRPDQMARYFRVSPEPAVKREACLTGWSAVALVVASAVLFAVHLREFAWLTALFGVLVWLFALEQTVGYETDYRRSVPKPNPVVIKGFLQESLEKAVTNALEGTNLTAEAVEATIRRALGLPPGDRTYRRPPVVHGPVHDDKDLPVILGETARYRAYNVLVLCPTDHHLFLYRGRLNMISGKIGKVEFREVYPRDVTLMSVVDRAPDVTFHVRNDDGTLGGTRTDKEKLRELTIGSGQDEDKFAVLLTPGPELDTFLTALRGLLKEHKTADTAVRIVKSVPLPVHIEAPLPVPVRITKPPSPLQPARKAG